MASLKSLMKAKKESARIAHPHAKYTASGQLSCSLCGTQLKNEAIWGSHLVSKQHRVNVQNAEREQQRLEDRRAAESEERTNGKRKSRSPSPALSSKRPKGDATSASSNKPFVESSASRSLNPPTPTLPVTAPPDEGEDDPSIDEFLSSLSADPSSATTTTTNAASATISAAPVKFEFGAPKIRAEGEENEDEDDQDEAEVGETEEERKEREEREEREEMMARLEEEEREQREADEKVTALKRRLELLRQARKVKKA